MDLLLLLLLFLFLFLFLFLLCTPCYVPRTDFDYEERRTILLPSGLEL
jgi:hypothetical protein